MCVCVCVCVFVCESYKILKNMWDTFIIDEKKNINTKNDMQKYQLEFIFQITILNNHLSFILTHFM